MKSKLARFVIVVGAVTSLSLSAQATPITGTVDLGGLATADSGNFELASYFTFTGVTVGYATGTYAPTVGTGVSMSELFINPLSYASPLWQFTYGGSTYNFTLSSASVAYESSTQISLSGSGTLEVGSDSAPGTWTFSTSNTGGPDVTSFIFQSSNTATGVPDGGTTVLLLGAALAALGLLQRRLA